MKLFEPNLAAAGHEARPLPPPLILFRVLAQAGDLNDKWTYQGLFIATDEQTAASMAQYYGQIPLDQKLLVLTFDEFEEWRAVAFQQALDENRPQKRKWWRRWLRR